MEKIFQVLRKFFLSVILYVFYWKNFSNILIHFFNVPENFSSTCGFRVDAKIDASKSSYDKNDEGLVKFFNLTIYDSARMYDELKNAQETSKAAAARAKKAEFEQSKGIKPKL